jgi:general secretion pathway protein K
MPPAASEGGQSAGFVLIPVIWVVALLAMAVISYTLVVRSTVRSTASSAGAAEAAALAEAGINLALHDLVNARAVRSWPQRFPIDGSFRTCAIGAGRVAIAVSDEAGKVDLNEAGEPLLRALLIGLGEPRDVSARLAAAILDYRDADNERRSEGAERAQYLEAGRETGPKNASFNSPLELAQVLGFDTRLANRVFPYVTVHSSLAGVDPSSASPALIEILAAGQSGSSAPVTGSPSKLTAGMVGVSSRRVVAITAQAVGEKGGTFARSAIIKLNASGTASYTVLSWRQVGAAGAVDGSFIGDC